MLTVSPAYGTLLFPSCTSQAAMHAVLRPSRHDNGICYDDGDDGDHGAVVTTAIVLATCGVCSGEVIRQSV